MANYREDSLTIEVRESLEGAIREFKRGFETSGLLREIKRRSHFIPKGEARRLKSLLAKRRAAKEAKRKARFQARFSNRKNREVKV